MKTVCPQCELEFEPSEILDEARRMAEEVSGQDFGGIRDLANSAQTEILLMALYLKIRALEGEKQQDHVLNMAFDTLQNFVDDIGKLVGREKALTYSEWLEYREAVNTVTSHIRATQE